jgi:hypothetical protein
MNKEIAERWIVALQSEDVRQIQGRLANAANGRCCLGVLCDIAVADGVIEREDGSDIYYDDADGVLPLSVVRWAGMNSENGGFLKNASGETTRSLAGLNDEGVPFADLIPIIRENVDVL